ncbi:hypothetical protein BHU09_01765 [Tannerella sp. oral taxon 808]|nr:hypothetical protein BHU09_01765 [Tannerella sp. oral taxon 808]
MTRILSAICCAIILWATAATNVRADAAAGRYARSSALAEGRWVKIRVPDDGIYKLTYAELRAMGFADPAKVSVHGYGGWILDEDFSRNTYIDDLPATPIYRATDYILFYGRGPVKWSYDSKSGLFSHENNPYAMHGYYFVTDATPTVDMGTTASSTNATRETNTFDEHLLHEVDREFLQKLGQTGSGRELFGESFASTLSQVFPFSVPGITADEGRVTLRFVAYTGVTGAGNVTLSIDGTQLLNGTIPANNRTYTKACEYVGTGTWSGTKSEAPKVTVTYNKAAAANSFLDYIRLQARRRLQSYGKGYTLFRDGGSMRRSTRFVVSGATSQMLVFDVTNPQRVSRMQTHIDGAQLSFSIPASGDSLREFALVDPSKSFPTPETVGPVATQNLHALPQTDMVILAPPTFLSEAERLAMKHRTKRDSISVVVVTPEQVYNEFSSGTPEATAIRRFMKMFYDRRTSAADAPKYLLLFGDGAHDNRQLSSAWKAIDMKNFLLTYQTRFSLGGDWEIDGEMHETYVTDDYFGFLDDGEGARIGTCHLRLGIGRFPVRTLSQARAAVNKVISYIDNPSYGAWKNNLCFIGDDGNASDSYRTDHMDNAYVLAKSVEQSHPEYIAHKILFDAYKKSSSGGGGTGAYPDVVTAIRNLQREGTMLINYSGHGNAQTLSDEHVITQSMIQQYTYTHLPLWITASCDFTPFDHTVTSAGEDVFLNEKSGGIGLITTSRVAYAGPNFRFNELLMKYLFNRRNGRRPTIGEVLMDTKNDYAQYYTRCFVLIGDPALTLAFPSYTIRVTEINGQPVTNQSVNFRALDRVTIKGEVLGTDSAVMTDFNGTLTAVVLDSEKEITTLDNNRVGKYTYIDYPNTIHRGNTAVTGGRFTLSFIVPADISYSKRNGKMSLYAYDATKGREANGAFRRYTVGGTATHIERDTIGPEIRQLYLNDSTWRDGDDTNETPFFVARLWDKSGVNITGSSIGHDITLKIDNNPTLTYSLNSYYTDRPETAGEGIVRFSIPRLAAGLHTAEFKAWDIFNNSTTRTFTFRVVEGLKPFITELRAGPVPARDRVTFYLSHNRPESRMEVTIQVYDMTGRLQWQHTENGSSELFRAYTVSWDLTSGSGARLRPGVYIYRAAIRTAGSSEATRAQKMVILRPQ